MFAESTKIFGEGTEGGDNPDLLCLCPIVRSMALHRIMQTGWERRMPVYMNDLLPGRDWSGAGTIRSTPEPPPTPLFTGVTLEKSAAQHPTLLRQICPFHPG